MHQSMNISALQICVRMVKSFENETLLPTCPCAAITPQIFCEPEGDTAAVVV